MCRMIAAVGAFNKSAVIKAVDRMSKCLIRTHELSITHTDGWGAAFQSEVGTLDFVRREEAISQETAEEALAAVDSTMLVIHARRATRGGAKLEYVHPAECEIHGQRACFFHNGTFADGMKLLKKNIEWDTKALLELLLPAFHSEQREEQIRRAFADLSSDTTSVNFILAESDKLTICEWHGTKSPKYYTLYTLKTDGFTLVCSDIIPFLAPKEQWTAVPNKTIFQIDLPAAAQAASMHTP